MLSLQHKAWVILVATVTMLTALAVLFSSRNISTSFRTLELGRAQQDQERAARLLAQELAGLSATGKDYAYWTDSVTFLAGDNPSFLEDNFTADSMKSLRLSGVLMFDPSGRLVGGVSLNADGEVQGKDQEVLPVVSDLVLPVVQDPGSATVIDTYRRIGEALLLVSVAPVREPAAVGSVPKGAQVVFRRLGKSELDRFGDVLLNPVAVSFDAVFERDKGSPLRILSDTRAEAWAVVQDHQNRPVAQLVVSLDRQLHQQGQSLVWASAAQVALTGLVLGALLLFLLDRLILRRLNHMHGQLRELAQPGARPDARIDETGRDELSDLARGLNRVLLLTRQIADQREAYALQEAQQASRAQTEKTQALRNFVRGIAHDLNNSLAAITGWQRLAAEDLAANHPSLEAVQYAQKSTRYATDLMRQLQAYTGQSTPKLQHLSLTDLLESARTLFDPKRAAGCRIQVTSLTDNAWVQADPTQLQQVLLNLLINASEAMGGKGTIHIQLDKVCLDEKARTGALTRLAAGEYVMLTVRDEGSGIAPEHLERIFEPYFSTKSLGRGTGLGLAVTDAIVTGHGGAIKVESQWGAGASFTLYLPFSNGVIPSEQEKSALAGTVDERSVLFADDDELVRRAWSSLLERHGWQVTQASDGEAAWELFQARGKRWSVVLTDLAMPKLNGHDLALRISETTDPPPVVLMSGHVGVDEEYACATQHLAAVLHKPVDPDDLIRVLHELCRCSGESLSPVTTEGTVAVLATQANGTAT